MSHLKKFYLHLVVGFFSLLFLLFYYFNNYRPDRSSSTRALSSTSKTFPADFKWCVATAAHQIEGGNVNNDWWEWEQLIPSKIKNNDSSIVSTDHWNKIAEDTNLMVDLGIKQYRFSIEWSRIEPEEGKFDQSAMKHYIEEIKEIKKNGIDPMVTLHHFTSPLWFSKIGGWANPKSPEKFLAFVKFVRSQLGGSVEQWITFNEPMVMLLGGYASGIFPPGISDWNQLAIPLRNILISHAQAYKELHKNAKALVGLAHHLRVFDPYHQLNPIHIYLAYVLEKAFNWTILNALKDGVISVSVPTLLSYHEEIPMLKNTQDFIGVNYYSRDFVKYKPKEKIIAAIVLKEKNPKTDLNWEIYPHGILRILRKIHNKFGDLPIYVTENGIADAKDSKRSQYLIDHLSEIQLAIDEGIDVRGYCHWSLMDNFEWNEGYSARFGLYEMDYKTLKRIPRKSASLYKEIIHRNAISVDN